MLTSIPNLLTIFRIIVVPLLVLLFYIHGPVAIWTAVVLFTLAGISDYFDGKIARATGQTSAFGQFLDPIADKLLIVVSLFLVVAFEHLTGYWILAALVILIREILIAGLREFLGPHDIQVPVSKLAKWKTTIQMVFMGFIIAGPYGSEVLPYAQEIGEIGLVVAAVITVVTGWNYLSAGYETIKKLDLEKKKA